MALQRPSRRRREEVVMVLRRRFLTGLRLRRSDCRRLTWAMLACLALLDARPTLAEDPPISLKIVGGLAGVTQYTRYEMPFWTEQVPRLTHGRVRADIAP